MWGTGGRRVAGIVTNDCGGGCCQPPPILLPPQVQAAPTARKPKRNTRRRRDQRQLPLGRPTPAAPRSPPWPGAAWAQMMRSRRIPGTTAKVDTTQWPSETFSTGVTTWSASWVGATSPPSGSAGTSSGSGSWR